MVEVLPPWVHSINQKKRDSNDVSRLFFFLMKELHLSYHDILEMPIPAVLALSEELGEYAREQEKQSKKASRGR